MIVYFDTSAMMKRYLAESGSDAVTELWNNASLIAASQLLYAEMIATFARKRRATTLRRRATPIRLPAQDAPLSLTWSLRRG